MLIIRLSRGRRKDSSQTVYERFNFWGYNRNKNLKDLIILWQWRRVRTQQLAAPRLWCYFSYFCVFRAVFQQTLITITVVRPYWFHNAVNCHGRVSLCTRHSYGDCETSGWIVIGAVRRRRWKRDRKQERGSRSGLLARLRKDPHRPPLLSMFLTNPWSQNNKMDVLELLMDANRYIRGCCLLVISESWRPEQGSGKSRGGGLCIYVHGDWSKDSLITHKHCSPDLESLSVKCRPFYLPRELTAVLVTAACIPPDTWC